MIDFQQISDQKICFHIDLKIFNETVVSKSLYWLSDKFVIYTALKNDIQEIGLELKNGNIDTSGFEMLKQKINQHLIDYKTRDIINQETKDIRNILYVKAFSNNDSFDDFYLTEE